MNSQPKRLAAVFAASAILVAACGSSTATTAPSTAASAAPSTAASTAPTTAASTAPSEAASASPAASAENFSGVTINVATFTGPAIATPLQAAAATWSHQTGGTVNITTFPFSDLYQKEITDAASGQNAFTLYTMASSWLGDFASAGYAEDLTSLVPNNPTLQWNDILPFYRNISSSYGGKIFAVPFDGDMLFVYYRRDLLSKDGLQPPKTWDDYLKIAAHYQGKDLNGDGKPDYGSCIEKAPGGVATWLFNGVLASYTQSLGTKQGVFFHDNMSPNTSGAAMAAALKFWKDSGKYGPPDEVNLDQSAGRGLFQTGRCALTIDWADTGVLAFDKTVSKVAGKVGTIMMPGSTQVLDPKSGNLVACDATTCPYAIDGVNHAPFAAFGGWTGVINAKADPRAQAAALSFISYVSSPGFSNFQVTQGVSGMNPFRASQLTDLQTWKNAGFDDTSAASYLGAIKDSLSSPNAALDLRISRASEYTNTIEDQAIAQFLAGQLTADAAQKQITDAWNALTDKIGRAAQQSAYSASLGAGQ